MKRIYILLIACLALVACKKNSVQFTFSPESPRAGQTVSFANLSTSGEEWLWTFGDGSTSSFKSPTHVFKQAGTYRIVLKVDNNNSWTATKEITVFDTVPTFVCDDSTFVIYKNYTFTANVYNPYNYEVKYQWAFPINTPYFVSTDETLTGSTLHGYFLQALDAPINLTIILNGDTTRMEKTFTVQDRKTNSILFRTADGDYRQRIFGERAEMYKPTTDTALLHAEQDTFQIYNKDTFNLSEMQLIFPELQGFHIAKRKFYYRDNTGLWVANIDGSYNVQIDTTQCVAMTLDTHDNRIYWANKNGVWYMPFIGSDNNQFVTSPQRLNSLTTVQKIAADIEEK